MGLYEEMDREVFEQMYPDVPYPQSFPMTYNTKFFNWGTKKTITICEYYKKVWRNFTLYQLSTGECVTKKEYNKRRKAFEDSQNASSTEDSEGDQLVQALDANQTPPDGQTQTQAQTQMPETSPESSPQMPQPNNMMRPLSPGIEVFPTIVNKRKSKDYKIMCYKAIFGKILECYEWPGKEFPIAMMLGDEVMINGEPIIISMTRYAKDPQRFLNFLASDLAQAAKNNRREQFIGTPDNIAGYEQFWKNPGNVAGMLLSNPDSVTKQLPIKLSASELPQTLVQNLQQADRDLRSIMGYPQDNNPRNFGNLSGKAIREMQRDGNSSNLMFFDNLKRTQEQIGRSILSLLPRVYDTERTINIQGVDGKSKQVTVNKKIAGAVMNDLTKGEFDISVDGGANYAVQKEEALQVLLQLIQVIPGSGQLVADIIAKNVDIEDSIELTNRFKTMVPPQVLAQASGQKIPPQPPSPQQQAQMQAQQMQQQIEQGKLQVSMAKAQAAQQAAQAQQQLNQVKYQQAQIDMESARLRAYSELQKAGFDYKASMAQSAAKVAQAHAHISEKHFETIQNIHGLQQAPIQPIPMNAPETTPNATGQ
jgi:hypothetical protein